MSSTPNIAASLTAVRTRIAEALARAGRQPDDARLIAVSKKQPVELIRLAYAEGQRDFGENYVQELTLKVQACADLADIRWHMIGHLQKNKARFAAEIAAAVHTVDSVELAVELGKRRANLQPTATTSDVDLPRGLGRDPQRLAILVEVNVGGELQKSGCSPDELPTILAAVEQQASLELVGLMTVPPFNAAPEASLTYFSQLAELRTRAGGPARLPHLSMGMSADLEQAVFAGSTLVRVGTAIFGDRAVARTTA